MQNTSDTMESLSGMEVKVISFLEFEKKYFFTRNEVKQFFRNNSQLTNFIHRLSKKKRIIKLNKTKYYLIPIRAKTGKWSENPFVLADEIMNKENYYIGGWAAANYWNVTEQIPANIEVYTNKRNGSLDVLDTKFIFRKTTQKRINSSVIKKTNEHEFRILNKKDAIKWMKSRI